MSALTASFDEHFRDCFVSMTLQLPVFWEDDVKLWLRFVGNLFEMMNITANEDKISLILNSLPPNLRCMVLHRISIMSPVLTYKELENAVISCTKADFVLDIECQVPIELLEDDSEEPV